MATNPKRKKPTRKPLPMTSAQKAARQALVRADVLGLEAARSRVESISKGAIGGLRLRSAGSLDQYLIAKPEGDKMPRLPALPKAPKPGTYTPPTRRTAPRKKAPTRKPTTRRKRTTTPPPTTYTPPKPRTGGYIIR